MSDCGCSAIDIHTHIVPRTFRRTRAPGATAVAVDGAGAGVPPARDDLRQGLPHGGRRQLDVPRAHRGHGRDARSTRQVLSPMPELLSYWLGARGRRRDGALPERADRGDGRRARPSASSAWARCRCRTSTRDRASSSTDRHARISPASRSASQHRMVCRSAIRSLSRSSPPPKAGRGDLRASAAARRHGPPRRPPLPSRRVFPGDIGLAGASMITGGNADAIRSCGSHSATAAAH